VPITASFSEPFYTGGASSSDFSGQWDVALNGRPYLLDLKSNRFRHISVPLLRQQADQATSPSESSINPADLWRRSQDTWHKGAGQSFLDRGDSDPERFHTSKGVDVWTKWQLRLLPATTQKRSSANSNLMLVVVGSYLYLIDGAELRRTTDMTTWTNVTGVPAGAPTSVASDGFNVWTAHTANGIFGTTRGAGTTAQYTTGNVTLVGYVKGRLLAAYQPDQMVESVEAVSVKTRIGQAPVLPATVIATYADGHAKYSGFRNTSDIRGGCGEDWWHDHSWEGYNE